MLTGDQDAVVQKVLDDARDEGALSYEALNERLPVGIVLPEQIEQENLTVWISLDRRFADRVRDDSVARIKTVQDYLERPLVLENPSTYLEFADNDLTEWEFVARLAKEADCGLLFDVNNVYVSAYNHGYDPVSYIDAIPADRVCQYHLAGHTNKGTHIIDTHSDHVVDPVWELFGHTIRTVGLRATLLEWDADIPPFEVVHQEVLKANDWRRQEVADVA